MRQPAAPSALHALIAAVPDHALRELVFVLMLNAAGDDEPAAPPPPAPQDAPARKPGWPKGRRRKTGPDAAVLAARRARAAQAARIKRARRKANPANGTGKPTNGTNGDDPAAAALWQKAEVLMPNTPWRAIARACGANEAVCLEAFRTRAMPLGVTAAAIERFLGP